MLSALVGQDACDVRWTSVTRTYIQSVNHDPNLIQKYSPNSETQKSVSFWGGCLLNNISLCQSYTKNCFALFLRNYGRCKKLIHIMRTSFKLLQTWNFGLKSKQNLLSNIMEKIVRTDLWKKKLVTTQQWKKNVSTPTSKPPPPGYLMVRPLCLIL